jgi:hypothetical protein
MPHRRRILQDMVPWLLQDKATREFLSQRRAAWTEQFSDVKEDRHRLDVFLARFDPANYTQTTEQNGIFFELHLPADLEEQTRIAVQESELKSLSVELLVRARQYLDDPNSLKAEAIPNVVAEIKRLANWQVSAEDRDKQRYRINSIAGGIAALIVHHQSWLSETPEAEKWCLDTLRQIKPVEESEFYSPASTNNHSAESFLGEAGIALLCRSREEWVLKLAFNGVTGSYYSSTMHTMWRAYVLRDDLGSNFGELVNVVVMWSALRRAAISEFRYHATAPQLAKYKEGLWRRYSADKLNGPLIPLRERS